MDNKAVPVTGRTRGGLPAVTSNRDWWPNQLNLKILRSTRLSNPMSEGFNYAEEFKKLDLRP